MSTATRTQDQYRVLVFVDYSNFRPSMDGCPACGVDMRGTEEKGVDTRIAADLISMAWDGSYNVAALVSSDRDFVPVVKFLQNRSIKIVHGAFPPIAAELSQECWARIAIPDLREQFRLAPSGTP